MAEVQQAGIRRFRYKLNDNWRGEPAAQICGVDLSRHKWAIFKSRVIGLQRVVRSIKNPAGIVDVEEFYASANEEKVLASTVPKTTQELPTKIYELPHLSSMRHVELMDIARAYGINPNNKKDKVLIREIMEAQDKRSNAPAIVTPDAEPFADQ